MWPWTHLAFGYLLYSGYSHLWNRTSPGDRPVVALALATQVPDLIDKPLSWTFGLAPTGYSIGHSLFVFLPLCAGIGWLAIRSNRLQLGLAVAVGYGSHLIGDIIYAVLLEGAPISRVLWPVVTPPARQHPVGFVTQVRRYLNELLVNLLAFEDLGLILMQITLFLFVFSLWLVDGVPGIRPLLRRGVPHGS